MILEFFFRNPFPLHNINRIAILNDPVFINLNDCFNLLFLVGAIQERIIRIKGFFWDPLGGLPGEEGSMGWACIGGRKGGLPILKGLGNREGFA